MTLTSASVRIENTQSGGNVTAKKFYKQKFADKLTYGTLIISLLVMKPKAESRFCQG